MVILLLALLIIIGLIMGINTEGFAETVALLCRVLGI
jgi:hypothetical protein